ncbi:MAG: hypothetical protein M3Q85_07255 [Acidobacteriota bacterium]|nr:hypothetical protein [Acidobacteriota bacterium]
MTCRFRLVGVVVALMATPAWAQQDDVARLRAELQRQQVVIAELLQRLDQLEKKQAGAATRDEVTQEAETQQEVVNSLRESLLGRVNLGGYYNFRFAADSSETPVSFQQHHLGLLLSKQLRRFNFHMELELQNVPHHPELRAESGDEAPHLEEEAGEASDISGEGQVAVENAWMEYNHNRFLNVRVGKQLAPQYWWQNHYPNLTLSTDQPIYLRELFPPELIGVMAHGNVTRASGESEFGIGYKLYLSNNQFEGNSQRDLRDAKSWGGRVQVKLPTGGALKRFDMAADLYRGRIALVTQELVDDHVYGVESQVEIDRFQVQGEYARGRTLGQTRYGYYVQPAVRMRDDWLAFYRVEQLDSPRIHRAEVRHLGGVNFRPYPQIAVKAEFYRAVPQARPFVEHDERPYRGFAAAAVFFF